MTGISLSGTGASGGVPAYQFNPDTFGGKRINGAAFDVNTNSTAVVTSPTIAADPAAPGCTVIINGANGATSGPLVATILSVNPGTNQVTLSAAAGATVTGCAAAWGIPSGAAIKAAVNAALANAVSNGTYYAEVFFPAFYIDTDAPVQQTSPFALNAQIPCIPNTIDVTGASRKIHLALKGPAFAGHTDFFESKVPNLAGGGIISTQTAPSVKDPTFGNQSVFGCASGGGAFTGGFANIKIILDGITVYYPVLTNMYAFDFGYIASMEWTSFSAKAFAPANVGASPRMIDLPSILGPTRGVGCQFPLVGNNDDVAGRSFAGMGISLPFIVADHFTALRVASVHCDVAGRIDLVNGISGNAHSVSIGLWSVEDYNGGLQCNGGGGSFCDIDITMDSETIGGAANPNYDVSDPSNCLRGTLRLQDANGRTVRSPVFTGAGNLRVINDLQGRGVMASPPAVPASGTPLNNVQRDSVITLTTGVGVTVSAISIAGVSTGLTMAASSTLVLPILGVNQTITLTYAGGTPTWSWRNL